MNRLPSAFRTTRMEARLTAGPAISITSAAPGESPFIMSAAATGMLPVEQMYMGTATTRMTSICSSGFEPKWRKNSSGTSTWMRAARIRPMTRRSPMFWIMSK